MIAINPLSPGINKLLIYSVMAATPPTIADFLKK